MTTYNQSALQRLARTALVQASAQRETLLAPVLCAMERSDHYSEVYPWVGDAAQMVRLRGELQTVGLSDALVEIVNETYAVGIYVPRNDLKDDRLGIHMKRVRDMAIVALNFSNHLIIQALVNGTSLLGFDGVSFYNDAHPARGEQTATQDNLLAGTGVTTAALQTDINSFLAAAKRWSAENAQPLYDGRTKFAITAPVELMRAFKEATGAPLVANTSNVFLSGVDLRLDFSGRLADQNDWYGHCVDGIPSMPLIFQESEGVEMEVLAEGSDEWVKNERALFKVRFRGAVGYGHPGASFKFVN